jgi:hypothetical protein
MRGNYLFTMALLACAACTSERPDGTSTGNPVPGEPDAGPRDPDDAEGTGDLAAGGYCKAGEKTALGLNEDSPLGFSAADILAFSSGTRQETIRWNPQLPGVALSPESGEQEVTITVTASGEPRFVQPKPRESNGAEDLLIDIEDGCFSWVEIDVDVTVETSGGALDESFEGVLRAHSPLTSSIFYGPAPDELGGDFAVAVSGDFEGFTLAQLGLNIRFSPYGAGGTFDGLLEMSSGGAVTGGPGGMKPFADFGAGTCGEDADGFTVGLDDEVEGATLQDALDMFAADDEVELTWENGATTTSSLTFAPATQGGCVLLDNESVGDLTLLTEGTLSMTSADGRLDGEWPGRIEAHVEDDGSISRIVFMLEAKLPEHSAPGANAAYGFPNDEIASFDGAGVRVDVTVTDTGVTGIVALTGFVRADCAQTPPDDPGSDADPMTDPGSGGQSTSGCRGDDPVVVANGVIE